MEDNPKEANYPKRTFQNKCFILLLILISILILISFFITFYLFNFLINDTQYEFPKLEKNKTKEITIKEFIHVQNSIFGIEKEIKELKNENKSLDSSTSNNSFYFDFDFDLINYEDPYSFYDNESIRFIDYPNYNKSLKYQKQFISQNQIKYQFFYGSFALNLPHFLNNKAFKRFVNDFHQTRYEQIFDKEKEQMVFNSSINSLGNITYFKNYSFQSFPNCTPYGLKIKDFEIPNSNNIKYMEKVVLAIAEHSTAFQHWIDRVLGSLIRIRPFIKDKGWTLLVDSNMQEIPYKLLNLVKEDFNVKLEVYDPSITYKIDKLLIICNIPFVHPRKFQEIKTFLVKNILKIKSNEEIPNYQQENIIYLPRVNNYNGRNVINNEEVENYLRKRFGNKFKIFSHKEHENLKELVEYFSKAKVIIGSHGGAFYNLLFASSHPIIIEFQGKRFLEIFQCFIGYHIQLEMNIG
ncbi:hypothetical protein M0811_05756 [Anaeramoeba ignava]|uniref:Glycosyltransferase 61 catalytic domain-containing protein n=1 Tax=Anaeramoeba ignava TaxID=1746090 RepID=A0A9Q0LRE9_ANAIG|nr:hypothetical protein M0811_05756 [Anaeramoeba ignava]